MSMETSAEVGALAEALSKAQAEIKGASKDSDNPFFKSKYADLASVWEACRTALTNHGIAVIQGPAVEGNLLSVTTLMLHASGQWARSALSTTLKDQSPQVVGSATTYLRRYGLAAMAGVAPEDDDDGNAAQGGTDKGPQGRAARRDALQAPAVDGPYAARENERATKTAHELQVNGYEQLQERMKKWPAEIAAIIPPDRALYLMPEDEAEANRQMYLDGIQEIADRRKLKPAERQELRTMFVGGPSVPLKTANIYVLRALWKFMDTEKP